VDLGYGVGHEVQASVLCGAELKLKRKGEIPIFVLSSVAFPREYIKTGRAVLFLLRQATFKRRLSVLLCAGCERKSGAVFEDYYSSSLTRKCLGRSGILGSTIA
jgi:hypothetical protein